MKFILLLHIAFAWHCVVFGESRKKDAARAFLEGEKALWTTSGAVPKIPFVPELIFGKCVGPPSSCPSEYITFWYYERYNAPLGVQIQDPNDFLTYIKMPNHPWKVLIHGFINSRRQSLSRELIPEYFKHGDYNIIAVDYSPFVREKLYPQAFESVPVVARYTARFLDKLMNLGYFSPHDLHIIGFGLGAQVAGRIHKYLVNGKPFRVTGLDPAFALGIINDKLNVESGTFVDVIHTDVLLNGQYLPSGHVDFYINGGSSQPGCIYYSKEDATCNHYRSVQYYAESINSLRGFWGIECNDYSAFLSGACNTIESFLIPMGEHVPYTARGVYYLQTRSKPPFAVGKRISPRHL